MLYDILKLSTLNPSNIALIDGLVRGLDIVTEFELITQFQEVSIELLLFVV